MNQSCMNLLQTSQNFFLPIGRKGERLQIFLTIIILCVFHVTCYCRLASNGDTMYLLDKCSMVNSSIVNSCSIIEETTSSKAAHSSMSDHLEVVKLKSEFEVVKSHLEIWRAKVYEVPLIEYQNEVLINLVLLFIIILLSCIALRLLKPRGDEENDVAKKRLRKAIIPNNLLWILLITLCFLKTID